MNPLSSTPPPLWVVGAGKDLVVPRPSHTFFIHVEWVVCVFKVNGINELEQLTDGLGWLGNML